MKKCLLALLIALLALSSVSARPTIALVLSGGGAKGLLHIPIIQELERRGIYPDMVVGTSMGGLIGGLYAAGYSGDEIYDFVLESDLEHTVINIMDFSVEGQVNYFDHNIITIPFGAEGMGNMESLLNDEGINTLLRKAVVKVADIQDFDELAIPYRTIGTDFATGEGVVFSSGSLFDAMRSTMSIPIVFPAYILEDGTHVVDGGLVENLPASLARASGADIIIGVDVTENKLDEEEANLDTLSGVINQYLLINGQVQSVPQRQEVDYLIIPESAAFDTIDFSKTEEILKAGEAFVANNLAFFDEIEEALSSYAPFREPSFSYKDRGYITIKDIVYPDKLKKYASVFSGYIGTFYDEAFVEEFDALLKRIAERENKKQIFYSEKDGVLDVYMKEYSVLPSRVSIGLTDGFFATFGNGPLAYGFDINFTLSALFKGANDYTAALAIGQQNYIHLGLDYTAFADMYWTNFLWGGFGGYSVISSRYLADRYATRDWAAGLATGYSYRPSDSHDLSLLARAEFYYFGNQSGYITSDAQLWEERFMFLPYVSFQYAHQGVTERFYPRKFTRTFNGEIDLGYEDGFVWALDLALSLALQISNSFSLDLDVSVFSSRMPYELLSSYKENVFGIVSRDYLSLAFCFDMRQDDVLKNFGLRLGVFFMAHDGNSSVPAMGTGTLLAQNTNESLVPFSGLNSIDFGLSLGADYDTGFGKVVLSFSVLFSGRATVALRIK